MKDNSRPRSIPAGWWWAAGAIVTIAFVLGFAYIFGIARAPIVAGVLGPRTAVTVAAGVGALVAVAVSLIRAVRFVALPLAIALAVTTAISAPIVLARGIVDPPPAPTAEGQLRILSWNTNGDLVAPQTIASEAALVRANVIVLPDLDSVDRAAVIEAVAALHLDMVPSSIPGDGVSVLTDVSLGRRDTASVGEPVGSATLILRPTDTDQPTLVALHADQPTLRGNSAWRTELGWVADQCSRGDTIVAGDFNATLDELGEGGLGACRDAAASIHAGSVGSWPTAVPTWLAMPLDHILVSPEWKVDSFTVLTDTDHSGARHRPVVAVLSRR